jgi:hypothetical protein
MFTHFMFALSFNFSIRQLKEMGISPEHAALALQHTGNAGTVPALEW